MTVTTAIQKKSVTFNPTVSGVEILSIYDYTPREVAATCYSQEEMDRITNRCATLINLMETNDPSKAMKYCIRGLEGHTTVGRKIKKKNRSTSIAAVLEEQARQSKGSKEIISQTIADSYRMMTSSSRLCAQAMGIRDQQAAYSSFHQVQICASFSSITTPVCLSKSIRVALLNHKQEGSRRQIRRAAVY